MLDALQELRLILKATDKISMVKYFRDKKLDPKIIGILKDAKILVKTGAAGRSASWEWKSIDPNLDMVGKIQDRLRNIYKVENASEKERKQDVKKDTSKDEVKPSLKLPSVSKKELSFKDVILFKLLMMCAQIIASDEFSNQISELRKQFAK
jgi:hypothetical protein